MKPIGKVSLNIIKKKYLDYDELEMLDILLGVNISIKDALDIIKNTSNQHLIDGILKKLDEGFKINEIFKYYIKSEIKEYLSSFIKYLPFKDSLGLSLSINKKERDLKNNVLKNLSYPILLMTFSVVGIYLFNAYCFDPLINSFSGFKSDLETLKNFKVFLDIFITIIFLFILLFLILLLFISRREYMVLAYSVLQKYFKGSRLKEYLSSRFIIYFNECHKVGLKTKDSIEILKSLKSEPLISFIAFHIDKAFLSGKDMVEAMNNQYLDDRLKTFIKIAVNSSELNLMLEGYLAQFDKRFTNYTKRISKVIEVGSYCLIGIVIIFIYQLLFIPMGMIGGL